MAVLLVATGSGLTGCDRQNKGDTAAKTPAVILPYDNTNPVMYDNDWANDYVDWYLMALASAGDINYVGISTSSSVPPYNRVMSEEDLARQVKNRLKNVRIGRDSGFRNIPDPLPGTVGNLLRPDSGMIEDTLPIDAPGVRRIIEEAGKTAPDKPLVICVGGPLTAVASAWLMDNSIADNIIVAWLSKSTEGMMEVYGMMGFNGWSDSWAAYIVLEKLRLVQFATRNKPFSHVPRHRLYELPESEARDYMLTLTPDISAPEGDADGPPAISIMRPDYVISAKRVSFGGWSTGDGHTFPLFRDDPDSQAVVVTEADREVATEEWWRAMKNPAAWGYPATKNHDAINTEDTLIQQ